MKKNSRPLSFMVFVPVLISLVISSLVPVSPALAAQSSFTQMTAGAKSSVKEVTTAKVTIPANQLALLWVGTSNGAVPVISDPSRSWTMVASHAKQSGARRIILYKSISPVDTTSQARLVASSNQGWTWTMVRTPRQRIVQFAARGYWQDNNGAMATSAKVTLPNPGSGPVALGGIIHRNGRPFIAGSGVTLLGSDGCTAGGYSVICAQAEGRDSFIQTAELRWKNLAHWILIAVEVQ